MCAQFSRRKAPIPRQGGAKNFFHKTVVLNHRAGLNRSESSESVKTDSILMLRRRTETRPRGRDPDRNRRFAVRIFPDVSSACTTRTILADVSSLSGVSRSESFRSHARRRRRSAKFSRRWHVKGVVARGEAAKLARGIAARVRDRAFS